MASAPAALAARARREIQHQFFAQDAVRPDRAIEFRPSNGFERRRLTHMLKCGSIQLTNGNRYWLDVVAYDVDLRKRHRRVRNALIVVIVILAAAIANPTIGQYLGGA